MPEEAPIDYPALAREHAEGVIARALALISRSGVPAGHRILITFITNHSGVSVPADIAARYPREMTVVLEKQLGVLFVGAGGFSAELDFGTPNHTDWRHLTVPLGAVTEYRDGGYVITMAPVANPAVSVPSDWTGNVIQVTFPLQSRKN